MKRIAIRILVPAAMALLALGALAPAQSSALLAEPEIGRCVKVVAGTGEFVVASCTGGRKATGGNYDFEKATKKKFTSGGGLTVLETTLGKKIECAALSAEGEYYFPFPNTETFHLKLGGCKENVFHFECTTGPPGVVELVMFGEYGFIKNLVKEGKTVVSVGMDLELTDPQKFVCGPNHNEYKLEGGGIGAVTPIDKMVASGFTFKFTQSKGKQKPTHFQGGVNHEFVLEETFPPMPAEAGALMSTYVNSNEEALEIKAKE
jgi:hypothetical protein